MMTTVGRLSSIATTYTINVYNIRNVIVHFYFSLKYSITYLME
jgi:hypothetical protein